MLDKFVLSMSWSTQDNCRMLSIVSHKLIQVILFNCQTDAFCAAMDDNELTGSILSEIKLSVLYGVTH